MNKIEVTILIILLVLLTIISLISDINISFILGYLFGVIMRFIFMILNKDREKAPK